MAAQRPGATSNPRQLLIVALVVVLAFLAFRGLFFHENKYEKLAREVTVALQNNDLATVEKYQNAETATMLNRGIVGRAADKLAPLGKIKSVKEVTPAGAPPRGHEFTVTFEHGVADEKMRVDPQDKIVSFNYELTKGS
jgi:hypothetical protein